MIYDVISRVNRYLGINSNLDLALERIAQGDLTSLDFGRYDLAGDEVFLLIQDNELNRNMEQHLELHQRYADIHLVLEGLEQNRFAQELSQVTQVYDKASDIGFGTSSHTGQLSLDGQTFAIYFPGEAHQPNLYAGAASRVKKAVFKVLMN